MGEGRQGRLCVSTYQTSLRLDQRPPGAIHLVVKSTGVAQIVAGSITAPEWRGDGSTVDTLTALAKMSCIGLRSHAGCCIGGHQLTGWRCCVCKEHHKQTERLVDYLIGRVGD